MRRYRDELSHHLISEAQRLHPSAITFSFETELSSVDLARQTLTASKAGGPAQVRAQPACRTWHACRHEGHTVALPSRATCGLTRLPVPRWYAMTCWWELMAEAAWCAGRCSRSCRRASASGTRCVAGAVTLPDRDSLPLRHDSREVLPADPAGRLLQELRLPLHLALGS